MMIGPVLIKQSVFSLCSIFLSKPLETISYWSHSGWLRSHACKCFISLRKTCLIRPVTFIRSTPCSIQLDRSRRIVCSNSSLKVFQRGHSFATYLWKTRHLTLFLQYNNIPSTTSDLIVGDPRVNMIL